MASKTPHIIVSREEIKLVLPFNGRAQALLKQLVPNRVWDNNRKLFKMPNTPANFDACKRVIQEVFKIKPQVFSEGGDLHATHETGIDVTSKYHILGVSQDASLAEIKQAYRRMAVKLHPDKVEADREFFHMITKAYNTLKDPLKRRKYDLALRLMGNSSAAGTAKAAFEETGLKLTSKDILT